ncbi:MAG: hypothetical protein AAF658_06410 [Myxococcota bacterium]
MKKMITLVALAAFSTACGSSRGSAEERYLDAIQMKLDGDQRGYYDEMMLLAVEESDTRAGRRARTAVTGGSGILLLAAAAGVVGAVAVPNFLSFQAKASQAEAKSTLQMIYTAQSAFFAEKQRYCRTFAECGVDNLTNADSKYVYFMGADSSAGPGQEALRLEAISLMESLGIDPVVTKRGFVVVAVGNIDSDSDLDVWTIDESSGLYNVVSDP